MQGAVLENLYGHQGHRQVRPAGTRLFSLEQRAKLKGAHTRLSSPELGKVYVAGVALPSGPSALRHAAVAAILEVAEPDNPLGVVRIVHHVRRPAPWDLAALRGTLGEAWGCHLAVIGGLDGRSLRVSMGSAQGGVVGANVQALDDLLEAVSLGRISMYRDDGSSEYQDFWSQVVRARREGFGPQARLYVEPAGGDDGFLSSLALAAQAASFLASTTSGRRPGKSASAA